MHDLNSGRLACELKGFLGSPPATGVTPQGLWQIDAIKKSFVTEFEAEYAKMKKPSVVEEECVFVSLRCTLRVTFSEFVIISL